MMKIMIAASAAATTTTTTTESEGRLWPLYEIFFPECCTQPVTTDILCNLSLPSSARTK
jgi:hypothetical protein